MGCTMHCARAVSTVGSFGPIFPDGQGDCIHYCVPIHRTTQVLTQYKNSDNELKQMVLPTKMPDWCANLLVLPCGRSSPGGGWFSGGSRESLFTVGPLCARCAEALPYPGQPHSAEQMLSTLHVLLES